MRDAESAYLRLRGSGTEASTVVLDYLFVFILPTRMICASLLNFEGRKIKQM